jgi:hypothetical protein
MTAVSTAAATRADVGVQMVDVSWNEWTAVNDRDPGAARDMVADDLYVVFFHKTSLMKRRSTDPLREKQCSA